MTSQLPNAIQFVESSDFMRMNVYPVMEYDVIKPSIHHPYKTQKFPPLKHIHGTFCWFRTFSIFRSSSTEEKNHEFNNCWWNWTSPYTHISTCFSRKTLRKSENEWKLYEYAEHIWCDYWIFLASVSPATDHNLHKLCHVTKASCRADNRFKLQKKPQLQSRTDVLKSLHWYIYYR